MPAWRMGMAVGEWRQIPNSALSRVPISVNAPGNTGPQSKVIAWCGFSIDSRTSTLYSAANGGHTDYAGNEVDTIRLADDAPGWIERRASTPVSQIVDSAAHYSDGAPASRHSYYGAVCNEVRNRAMIMGGSRWGNGFALNTVDGFDISAGSWDTANTYPNLPAAASSNLSLAVVEHKATGDIYAFASNSVYRWSSASNAWSTVASRGTFQGFEAATALDSRRNRVLILGGLGGDRGSFVLGSSAMQSISLAGGSASAVSGAGNGMAYDPWLDAFLLRKPGAGATVYRIDAQTLSVDVLTTSGGSAIPSSTNGVYRRFLFAPQLGGVVYCPSYDGNLWFLRTT